MKALVTGGSGFIGSNIVRLLLEKGVNVRVYDNLSTGYFQNIEGLPVEFVQGDIRNPELTAQACEGVDLIFHLAASIGNVKSLKNPQEDSEVNVIGTLNVLEAARKNQVKRIVHSSSAAIFGELQTLPIAEDHPLNPDSPYGVSKLAAEKHMLCYGKIYGIEIVCLRYFNVYGVHQRYDAYGNVIPIFANRLVSGQPITIYGDGNQTRDFVNVKDVARINFLAATSPHYNTVYNVGSGTQITINQLAQMVQDESSMKAPNVVYAAPRPSEVLHCKADTSKAEKELGYAPTVELSKGLNEYFEWFKADCASR